MPLDTAALWELASLRDQGVLTEEEFLHEKSKVLQQHWIRYDEFAKALAMASGDDSNGNGSSPSSATGQSHSLYHPLHNAHSPSVHEREHRIKWQSQEYADRERESELQRLKEEQHALQEQRHALQQQQQQQQKQQQQHDEMRQTRRQQREEGREIARLQAQQLQERQRVEQQQREEWQRIAQERERMKQERRQQEQREQQQRRESHRERERLAAGRQQLEEAQTYLEQERLRQRQMQRQGVTHRKPEKIYGKSDHPPVTKDASIASAASHDHAEIAGRSTVAAQGEKRKDELQRTRVSAPAESARRSNRVSDSHSAPRRSITPPPSLTVPSPSESGEAAPYGQPRTPRRYRLDGQRTPRSQSAERTPRSSYSTPRAREGSPSPSHSPSSLFSQSHVSTNPRQKSPVEKRKVEGRLRLDVHTTAQAIRQELRRIERLYPVAQNAEAQAFDAIYISAAALRKNRDSLDPGNEKARQAWGCDTEVALLRVQAYRSLQAMATTGEKSLLSIQRNMAEMQANADGLNESFVELQALGPTRSPRPKEHGVLSPGTLASPAFAIPPPEDAGRHCEERQEQLRQHMYETNEQMAGSASVTSEELKHKWTKSSTGGVGSVASPNACGDDDHLTSVHSPLSPGGQSKMLEAVTLGQERVKLSQESLKRSMQQIRHAQAALSTCRDKVRDAQTKLANTQIIHARNEKNSVMRRSPPRWSRNPTALWAPAP